MRWKIFLLIFLLAFLISLIYFKPLQLPGLPSLTGLFSKILSSQKIVHFQLYLDEIRSEQSFQLLNKTFLAEGTCLTQITIGKVSIQTTSLPCRIEMYSPSGTIKVDGMNVFVEASSDLIRINDLNYITREKVSFQIRADYLFANVFSQNLKIGNFKGRFEKIYDGEVSTIINFPPCDTIELLDFSGTLIIREQTMLVGSARVRYWCENVKNKI